MFKFWKGSSRDAALDVIIFIALFCSVNERLNVCI